MPPQGAHGSSDWLSAPREEAGPLGARASRLQSRPFHRFDLQVTPQLATVQAYWTGKKYRNAKARREYDYSQHEPYLVPHTKSEHLLYCTLTKQPVRPSRRSGARAS